jgi:HEAT repeat protein
VGEPALRHDFLASVDRLGSAAVPVLRQELYTARSELAEQPERGARRGQLVAEGLGLVGALVAVPTLELALADEAPEEMRVACVRALGVLGAPSSVSTLSTAMLSESAEVRRVAAQSLGLVGGREAAIPLSTALHDADVEVARAAADGLRRCGEAGEAVLRHSHAPVAREVLALAAIGVRAAS